MATLTRRKDRKGRDRYYVLTWSDAAGNHREIIGTVGVMREGDAQTILRAKQVELKTGRKILNSSFGHGITFSQCAEDYLKWHCGEYPDSHYRIAQIVHDHLTPAFEFTQIGAITLEQAEEFKRTRRRVAKAHTVTKELRTLKAVLNWAVGRKMLDANPIEGVKGPRILDAKPHFFYEPADMLALYEACRKQVNAGYGPQPDPLHAAIWRFYANTGARRGEGMHLKKRWIGRDGIKLISTGEERTKSGDWREVPKTEGAAEALDRLKHAVDGEYVLPRVTLPSLSRAFVKDARRAGLGGSLHALRHTYISILMRDTQTPVRTIQLYAGHASITTTEGYLYLRTNLKDAPAARLAI